MSGIQVLSRLGAAMNAHDIDAFVDCFAPDYQSDQPAHPDRHFRGREQVRKNWTRMFAGLPDFHSEVVRAVADEDTLWVEWHWTGTRGDGTKMDAIGACIFGIRDDRIDWARLYMEDVEVGLGIDAAVESLTRSETKER